jgi:hypothetical protein
MQGNKGIKVIYPIRKTEDRRDRENRRGEEKRRKKGRLCLG